MKNLNKVLLAVAMLWGSGASADSIVNHFNTFAGPGGEYFLSGVLYSNAPDPITGEVKGIGTINEIRDNTNNIVWSSGQFGSWVNFVFNDYLVNTMSAPSLITGASNYTETLGKVAFYDAMSNIFSATGNWATDSSNIVSNSSAAFATLEGALRLVNSVTFSAYGSVSTTNVDGHGALDITGGTHGANFDTDSLPWGTTMADMSFDLSGTNQNTLGYAYSGTVSAKGLITPVPEPASLLLLGIGMLFIGVTQYSKSKVGYSVGMAA